MKQNRLLFGLFGGACAGALIVSSAAFGQEQAPQQTPQPPEQHCSFLGCLLKWRSDAPEPEPRTQRSAAEGGETAPAAVPQRAKPVHVVTIAADPAEVARLKRLAAALPKEKIKIVKVVAGARSATDFAMSTSLDANRGESAAKLFSEQLHIVAGPAIKTVADLNGKVVSFGPDKGPGQVAARRAFAALGVKVEETALDVDNALDGLATGDVAAVVLLAPQPFERLTRVSAPGLHLLAWPEGVTPPDGAGVASIDGSAYPTLARPGDTIRTMSVDALLTLSAKGPRQTAAKTFLKALTEHSDVLAKRGFDLLKADSEKDPGRHYAAR